MNYEFSRILKEGPLNGDLANGETNTATGSVSSSSQTARSESGDLSYIGRVNYAYDGRYLFEFLIRSDASTKFSPDNYWGVFPSVSVGWIVSEEKWYKLDWMDYLKVRASFGIWDKIIRQLGCGVSDIRIRLIMVQYLALHRATI